MKKLLVAGIIVLGIPLTAPFANVANAHGFGFGARSGSFAHNFRWTRWPRYFGQWPLYNAWTPYSGWSPYDGVGAAPAFVPYGPMGYAPPTAVFFRPELPSCHRSQQTVTVPSEDGGTRQVTVTRCAP